MVFGKHFLKYYYKYIFYFLIGIAFLVLINILQTNVPNLLGQIIDKFEKVEEGVGEVPQIDQINKLIMNIIYIVIGVVIGRFVWRMLIFGASRKIEHDLRTTMFNHATDLSQDFYSTEKVGGMMTYFINDLSAIRMAYGPGVMMIVDTIVIGIFTISKMVKIDPLLTLVSIIPLGLMVVGMYYINKSMRIQFRKRQEKFRDLSDYTQEDFSGITVIKAYVREAFSAITFRGKSEELYDANIKYVRRSTLSNIITTVSINTVIIVIIIFGSLAVIKSNGEFTTGRLFEYYSLFLLLLWPTRALARFLTISSQAQASAKRVADFLDSEVSVKDSDEVEDVKELVPSIVAKDLSFTYPNSNELVLDKLNFSIEPGQMVGILGKTGAGKTTLVDLLLRVYNVEDNTLFIGGHDVMKTPIKTIRSTVGYVPQDNFLFSDTISNNIAFAYDDLTDDEIMEAAKLSDIYSNIIEFKEGFNTVLGERGVTVSGGQKQRISIARAIAKNPDILILDDSVSAVDTKTEEKIISNLYDLRKGKTTIFIAHRISTVKNMDKIILLDEGKIVDVGTHDELIIKSPMYKDMVKRQELAALTQGGELDA